MSEAVLTVRNLHKSFGKAEVLRGIDLEVRPGETVALLGSSGCGKTTFLRCLNFLEKADSGTLAIAGQTVHLQRAHKKDILALRRKTAMVFQDYGLYRNKTVLQNVTEGLTVARGVPKAQAVTRALKSLEQVGMAARSEAYPHELSGGQQQRVGIARALALEPAVLLFDEPTSALDPEKVQEILDLIRSLKDTPTAKIIVTHEMAFAYECADSVIFMDEGLILEEGAPKDVFGNPKNERTRRFLERFTADKAPEYFI